MSKKINFFLNKFKKFKKNKALILENGKCFTYNSLISNFKKISKFLPKQKKLIFLLGQNNLETIAGYISFINKGHTVALLDYKINDYFLNKLILLSKEKIFVSNSFAIFLNSKKNIIAIKIIKILNVYLISIYISLLLLLQI